MPRSKIKISNGNKGIWTYYFYDEYETYEEAEEKAEYIKKKYKEKGDVIKRFVLSEGRIYPIFYLYLSKNIGEEI